MKIKRMLAFALSVMLVLPSAAFAAEEQSETLFEFKASDSVVLEVTEDLSAAHFDGPADDNSTELLPDGTVAPQYVIFRKFKKDTENYITMRYLGSGADSPKDFSGYDKENTKLELYLKAKPLLDSGSYKNIYIGFGTANREDHGWGDQVLAVDLAKYIQDTNLQPEGDWYKIQMPFSYMVANGKTVNASALDDSDYTAAGGYDVSKTWRYRQINSNQDEFCWKHVWGMSIGVITNADVTSDWSDTLYMSNPKIVKYTQQTTTPDTSDGETLFELKADNSVILEFSQDFSTKHFDGPQTDNETVKLPDGTNAPQYMIIRKQNADKANFGVMRYWGSDRNSSSKDFSDYDKENTKLELNLKLKDLIDGGKYKNIYMGFCTANFEDHGWNDQILAVDLVKYIQDANLQPEGDWYKIQMPLSYMVANGINVNAGRLEQSAFEAAGGTNYDATSWRYTYINSGDNTEYCWKHVWGLSFGVVAKNDLTEEWNDAIYFSNPKIVKYTAQTTTPDPDPTPDPEPTPDPTPDPDPALKGGTLAKIDFEDDKYIVGADINNVGAWTVEQRECDSAKVETDPDNSSNKVLAVTIDNTEATGLSSDSHGAKLNFENGDANGIIKINYKVKIKNSDSVSIIRPWQDRIGFASFALANDGEYKGLHLMGGDSDKYVYTSLLTGAGLSSKTWLAGEALNKWLDVTYLLNPKDYSVKVYTEQLSANGSSTDSQSEIGTDDEKAYITAKNDDGAKNTNIKKINNILFSLGRASSGVGKTTLYVDDINVEVLPFLSAEAKFDTKAADAEQPLKLSFNNKVTSNLSEAVSLFEKSGAAFPGKVSAKLSEDGKSAEITAEGNIKFNTEYVLKIDKTKVKDEYEGTFENDLELNFKTNYSNRCYIDGFKQDPVYSNGGLTASFDLKNASGASASAYVGIAAYNEKGIMLGIVFKEYPSVETSGTTDTLTLSGLKEAPKTVTAFVWNSKTDLTLRQKPFSFGY